MIDEADLEREQGAAEGDRPFVVNSFYERVLTMRLTRPHEYEMLAPVTKLALAYYEASKRRAEMLRDEPIPSASSCAAPASDREEAEPEQDDGADALG